MSISAIFFDCIAAEAHAQTISPRSRGVFRRHPGGGGGSGSRGRTCNPHSGDLRALRPHKCRKAAVERREASVPIARGAGRLASVPHACFASTHHTRLFGAPLPLCAHSAPGAGKVAQPRAPKGEKSPPGTSAALANSDKAV